MKKTYSYYMTQRPPMPGAMPTEGLEFIDENTKLRFINEIGRDAYARLTYKSNPGIRLRYLGSMVGCWHVKLIDSMMELEKEGKIKAVPHSDLANMEYYNEWYPV